MFSRSRSLLQLVAQSGAAAARAGISLKNFPALLSVSVRTNAAATSSASLTFAAKRKDPALLNRDIIDIMSDAKRRFEHDKFVAANLIDMDAQNISSVLFHAVKGSLKFNAENIKAMAKALEKQRISPQRESKILGNAIYGLKMYTGAEENIPYLIGVITEKLKDSLSALDSQFFSNALYGLQNVPASVQEARKLLSVLALKLNSSLGPLDAVSLTNSFYGLQKMESTYPEVQELLRALAVKLRESPDVMQCRHVAMALYGLQRMTFNESVGEVLTELLARLDACPADFPAKFVGSAAYGLICLSSEHEIVRKIVAALDARLMAIPSSDIEILAVVNW